MIPILLAAGRWLISSKTGRIMLLVLAGVLVFYGWTAYAKHAGYVKAQEEARVAAEAELSRVRDVMVRAQEQAQEALARQHQLEMTNAKLVAAASEPRPHDGDVCFDSYDSWLLNSIGKPASKGTGKPAGSPSR